MKPPYSPQLASFLQANEKHVYTKLFMWCYRFNSLVLSKGTTKTTLVLVDSRKWNALMSCLCTLEIKNIGLIRDTPALTILCGDGLLLQFMFMLNELLCSVWSSFHNQTYCPTLFKCLKSESIKKYKLLRDGLKIKRTVMNSDMEVQQNNSGNITITTAV